MKYFANLYEDPTYNTFVSNEWYKELQTLMKTVVQSEESIPNVPVLLMTAERDKITDTHMQRIVG